MIGALIGDIVGSRFEFNNHRSKKFELFTEECFITDDTIMTLAVAKAILETDKEIILGTSNRKQDEAYLNQLAMNTVSYMQLIGRNYPDCGYGSRFGQWIFSENPQPYRSYGNGAAMRISTVGAIAECEADVIRLSRVVTSVSHNHKEGIKGAEATSMAIFLARTGHDKEQICKYIEEHYYALAFTLDEIRDTYQFNETCQATGVTSDTSIP